MIYKTDFIASNNELINKEAQTLIDEYIAPRLKENGYFKNELCLDSSSGIVIAVAKLVKHELETYGWSVEVDARASDRSIRFEVS